MRAFPVLIFILLPVPAASAGFPDAITAISPTIIHSCYDAIPELPTIFGELLSIRLVGLNTPEMKGQCDEDHAFAFDGEGFSERPSSPGATE